MGIAQALGTWAGFAEPVFIALCVIAMWKFGTREKWSNEELSAYSVFNDGQQRHPGTFTADQVERDLRGGWTQEPAQSAGTSTTVRSGSACFKGLGMSWVRRLHQLRVLLSLRPKQRRLISTSGGGVLQMPHCVGLVVVIKGDPG